MTSTSSGRGKIILIATWSNQEFILESLIKYLNSLEQTTLLPPKTSKHLPPSNFPNSRGFHTQQIIFTLSLAIYTPYNSCYTTPVFQLSSPPSPNKSCQSTCLTSFPPIFRIYEHSSLLGSLSLVKPPPHLLYPHLRSANTRWWDDDISSLDMSTTWKIPHVGKFVGAPYIVPDILDRPETKQYASERLSGKSQRVYIYIHISCIHPRLIFHALFPLGNFHSLLHRMDSKMNFGEGVRL